MNKTIHTIEKLKPIRRSIKTMRDDDYQDDVLAFKTPVQSKIFFDVGIISFKLDF
jgi:hypothetical protein